MLLLKEPTISSVADSRHKTRLKSLEKKMKESLELLDTFTAKEYEIRHANDPSYHNWVRQFQAEPLATSASASDLPYPEAKEWFPDTVLPSVRLSADETDDDDPIQVSLRLYVQEVFFLDHKFD